MPLHNLIILELIRLCSGYVMGPGSLHPLSVVSCACLGVICLYL